MSSPLDLHRALERLHGEIGEAWEALRAILGPSPSPDPGEELGAFIRRAAPRPLPKDVQGEPVEITRLGSAAAAAPGLPCTCTREELGPDSWVGRLAAWHDVERGWTCRVCGGFASIALLRREALAADEEGATDPAEPVDPEEVRTLLLLVEDSFPGRMPTLDEIAAWTAPQRDEVAKWAAGEHLAASDHEDVVRLPIPDVFPVSSSRP